MSWRFRRIFCWGPFRINWTKRGCGFSLGIPGLRYGISPDGRRYISIGIPYTGFYWIKYLDRLSRQDPKNQNSQNLLQTNSQSLESGEPWWRQKGLDD